jgi:hypothetical protein
MSNASSTDQEIPLDSYDDTTSLPGLEALESATFCKFHTQILSIHRKVGTLPQDFGVLQQLRGIGLLVQLNVISAISSILGKHNDFRYDCGFSG